MIRYMCINVDDSENYVLAYDFGGNVGFATVEAAVLHARLLAQNRLTAAKVEYEKAQRHFDRVHRDPVIVEQEEP